MSFKTRYEQNAEIADARMESAKREAIAAIYVERQDFVRCEGNDGMIIDVIRRWTGYSADVLPSKAIFDEALLENPDEIKNFARQPLAVTKEQLTDNIIEILREKGKGHDEFSLKGERTRLRTFSIEQLRARLADLQRAADLAAQPVSSLKTLVAESRRPSPQAKVLPAEYTPERIKKMKAWEIKALVRMWGASVVNDRLFLRS